MRITQCLKLSSPIWQRIALLVLILGLSGCKSLFTAPSNFDPKNSNGLGLIVLSGRLHSTCNHGSGALAVMSFRSENTGARDSIPLVNTFWAPDFTTPLGSVVAKALPPGTYVINTVGLNLYQLRKPLGWSFEVIEGRVTYLGQIFTTVTNDCTRALFNLTNEWSRDADIVKKQYPKVNVDDVDIQILRSRLGPTNLP